MAICNNNGSSTINETVVMSRCRISQKRLKNRALINEFRPLRISHPLNLEDPIF